MASSGSKTAGTSSYSTRMRCAASSAISRLSAATAATFSPMKRTLSRARTGMSRMLRPTRTSGGRSLPTSTAWTPGTSRAARVSVERIRACGSGLRRTAPNSIPGRDRSAA
jgi:hypothetical protein